MALTREHVYQRINGMHLDDLDLAITRAGDGFAVEPHRGSGSSEDIGSSYEVPDSADDQGRMAFTAGPWTAFQYHSSITAPHRDNYDGLLDDLAAGDVSVVVVGCTPIMDNNTWVLAVRGER